MSSSSSLSSSSLIPSGLTLNLLTPSENEFFAESTKVIIKSFFDYDTLKFISGTYGPFRVDENVEVPLWLAITLKKKGKCSIIPPKWMLASELQQYIEIEKNTTELTPLDYHYIEIGTLLLIHAKDDIESPDSVSALLHDLQNIRIDRLKKGPTDISDNYFNGATVQHIPIPNVAAIEIDTIRGALCESMNVMLDLSGVERAKVSTTTRRYNQEEDAENTRSRRTIATGRRFKR